MVIVSFQREEEFPKSSHCEFSCISVSRSKEGLSSFFGRKQTLLAKMVCYGWKPGIFFLSKFISGNHRVHEAAEAVPVSPTPMVIYLNLLTAQLSNLTMAHSKK